MSISYHAKDLKELADWFKESAKREQHIAVNAKTKKAADLAIARQITWELASDILSKTTLA